MDVTSVRKSVHGTLLRASARAAIEPWQPRAGLDDRETPGLVESIGRQLRALLKGSAMKRAGVKRLRRNLAVAMGNSGDLEAAAALVECAEETARGSLVAEHVAWAIEKLHG